MGRDERDLPAGLRAHGVRRQLPWLLTACVTALGVFCLAPLASLASEGRIPTMDLLSDPAEVTGTPWYVGAVSDLNLLVWGAGAAVFLVAAVGLRRVDARLSAALAWLGALTVLLTLDDRFLLHEIVFPWLFGVSETVTFAIYAGVLALLLLRYWRVLLNRPEASIFVLALLGLGASVALDVLGWDSSARRMVEEAAKLLGAVAWSLFPAAIVIRHLSRPAATTGSAPDSPPGGSGTVG